MREGCLDVMTLIVVYHFIASNLVRLQDLFGYVLWFYVLFLLGKNNLTELIRTTMHLFCSLAAFISSLAAIMNSNHMNITILGEVEMNATTFLAVLILTDMYTFMFDLILFERIEVIIKTFFLALCTFLLVSAFVAYCVYIKFYFAEWVDKGPLNIRKNFISCRGDTRGIPDDTIINMSDQNLSSTRTTYIIDVENHVMSINSGGQFLCTNIQNHSITKYAIQRYIGEGARLECEFKVGAEILKQFYSIHPFISKDRLDIQNSYRHKIQTLSLHKSESLVFNITLYIFPLTKEDFSTYRAGIRLYQDSSENVLLRSSYQLYDEIYLDICVFSVSQIDDYYIYTDVPVGGLLRFRDLFLIAVSNSSNVRVEHSVNGVQIDLIPDISPKCCLTLVNSATVSEMKLLKHTENSSPNVYSFEIVAAICLCPSLFGIHRIKLVHDLYDPEEQTWKTLEFMHPQITVVYPTSPALPWINIYEQEKNLIEISKKDKDFSLFNGTLFQYLQNAKQIEFGLRNTFEIIITIAALLPFLVVMYNSLILFLDLVNAMIRLIVKIEILFQQYRRQHCQHIHESSTEIPVSRRDTEINMYEYDAFISHVEEDSHFVKEIIQPIILQHRLRVIFGDVDLPSGPRLGNSVTAIKQSKIVLIVISNEYLTDQFYNFLFPNTVFPSLHDGSITCEKIVLIRYKPCKIPNIWLTHGKIILYDTLK